MTLSINRPNVRTKVICEYVLHAGSTHWISFKNVLDLANKISGDPPPYKPSPSLTMRRFEQTICMSAI